MKKIPLVISFFVLGLSLIKAQSGCTPDSVTYSYTGVAQPFTVPSCVSTITVKAWGAGGGGGGNDSYHGGTGGGGAYVSSTISVTPGQVFSVVVGQGGTGGANNTSAGGGTGGYGIGNGGNGGNAGGAGASGAAGAGGGATAVLQNNLFVLAAGGGGGAGGAGNLSAGGNGGASDDTGTRAVSQFNTSCFCTDSGGKGGTINGGIDSLGAAGINRGASNDGGAGGGGGGGYNGGGGGGGGGAPDCDCGGGGGAGGSSLGSIIINGNGQTCGNNTYIGLPAGTGLGGVSKTGIGATAGGNGYLIIYYCVYYQTISAIPASPRICAGNNQLLNATGSNSYTWAPLTSITIINDSTVYAHPITTTVYTVTGTSSTGCKDSITDTVFVYPSNGFDLTGSLTACIDTPGVSTASIQACIYNARCLPTNGKLKLVLDTAFHITNTISDSITRTSGDTLYWNYDSLSDIGKTHCVTLQANISNMPANDSVSISMFITPVAGDYAPGNNSVTYWLKSKPNNCVGLPFDPNEKSVSPIGNIADTQKLTYTIHFQNTGTAIAHNVVVIDTLSPNLDPTTLKVLSASSEMITQVVSGHIIKFIFNNINLPDTGTSKTTSIGVFSFTIKPASSVAAGDKITNNAGIYFDYNAPIITNKTINTIAGAPLTTQPLSNILNIACFPNPFTTSTSVVFNTYGQHYLDLYDVTGRKIESIQCTGKQYELQRGNLSSGVYFIKAYNTIGAYEATSKLVIE